MILKRKFLLALIFLASLVSSSQAIQIYAQFGLGPVAAFGTGRTPENMESLYNPMLMNSQNSIAYGVGIRPGEFATFLGNFRFEYSQGHQDMWFTKLNSASYSDSNTNPYGAIKVDQTALYGMYYDMPYFGDNLIPYIGGVVGTGTATANTYDTKQIKNSSIPSLIGSGDHLAGKGSVSIQQLAIGLTTHLPNTPGEVYIEARSTKMTAFDTRAVDGSKKSLGVNYLGWNIGFRIFFIGGGGTTNK